MKHVRGSCNGRFEQEEQRNSELEVRSPEITQPEKRKEKKIMNNEQSLRDLGGTIPVCEHVQWESERKRGDKGEERTL